jgi:uncharacterized protein YjdB
MKLRRLSRLMLGITVVGVVGCGGGSESSGSCGGIVSPQRTLSTSPASVELDVGGQQQLSATATSGCPGDPPAPVTWQSGAPSIATVSTTGVVAANGPGTATITATAFNGTVSGTVLVTVRRPEVRSISLSDSSVRLRERQTRRVAATVVTSGNLTRRVNFVSRAPAIATVRVLDSLSAEITAVSIGSTVIDVISAGDTLRRATVALVVEPALVSSIRLSGIAAQDSLLIGTRRTITAALRDSAGNELRDRVVRWSSETPSTMSISSSGEVQAIRAGVARIAGRVAIGDGSGDRVDTISTRVFGSLDIALLPRTTTLEEGRSFTLQATVSATAGVDRTVEWESARPALVTVSAAGVVTGVSAGTVFVRARSRLIPSIVDSVAIEVLPRGVPTTVTVTPRVDTLFPGGTRTAQAVVRDQRGAVLPGVAISWRSLTPAIATVSASGIVSAVALGEAVITASTARAVGSDSLVDSARVLVVNPCTLFRPITLGSSYVGRIDTSTCKNFIGFSQLDQFSISTGTQAYYRIALTTTFRGSLIPLNIGTAFYGQEALANEPVESFAVVRPGSYGFIVAAFPNVTGSYSVSTSLNPDPRTSCAPTSVTTGVSFRTAVNPTCITRDLRLLPPLSPAQQVRITASAPSFPVRIELRSFNTGALLASGAATQSGGPAVISLTWSGDFTFAFVRVIGSAVHNDLVDVVIDR